MKESYGPYSNAVAKRVNRIFKQEFLLEDYNEKMDVMKLLLTDAIRIYNTKRSYLS